MSTTVVSGGPAPEAPLTLDQPAARTLGTGDLIGLWGNFGISLLLPVAAGFVVLAGRPLRVTLLAVLVGAVIGALLLGLGAGAGARAGVPAMGLLPGLFRPRNPALPPALNVVPCFGWGPP